MRNGMIVRAVYLVYFIHNFQIYVLFMFDKVRVYININFQSERQILQLQSFAESFAFAVKILLHTTITIK